MRHTWLLETVVAPCQSPHAPEKLSVKIPNISGGCHTGRNVSAHVHGGVAAARSTTRDRLGLGQPLRRRRLLFTSLMLIQVIVEHLIGARRFYHIEL